MKCVQILGKWQSKLLNSIYTDIDQFEPYFVLSNMNSNKMFVILFRRLYVKHALGLLRALSISNPSGGVEYTKCHWLSVSLEERVNQVLIFAMYL